MLKRKKERINYIRVIEDEMKMMINDDPETVMDEMAILANMRKMAAETNEEEEVLQTRIVSPREVTENWSDWLPAITNEVDSLLKEKEAFREIYPEELHKLQKEAERSGKGIEFIPSKLGFYQKARARRRKEKDEVDCLWQLGTKERTGGQLQFRCRCLRPAHSMLVLRTLPMGCLNSRCAHSLPQRQDGIGR